MSRTDNDRAYAMELGRGDPLVGALMLEATTHTVSMAGVCACGVRVGHSPLAQGRHVTGHQAKMLREEWLDAELARMRQFMLATPAQGPWLTVADQYLDWLSEEQEQER